MKILVTIQSERTEAGIYEVGYHPRIYRVDISCWFGLVHRVYLVLERLHSSDVFIYELGDGALNVVEKNGCYPCNLIQGAIKYFQYKEKGIIS